MDSNHLPPRWSAPSGLLPNVRCGSKSAVLSGLGSRVDVAWSHLKSSLALSRLNAVRTRCRYHNRVRSIGQLCPPDYLASNDPEARVKRAAIGAALCIKDWRFIVEVPDSAVNVRKVCFHSARLRFVGYPTCDGALDLCHRTILSRSKHWWAAVDSNHVPPRYQHGALPVELAAQVLGMHGRGGRIRTLGPRFWRPML